MSDISTFRRRVGDQVHTAQDVQTGNGLDTQMRLRYDNVWDTQVFVADSEVTTGFTVNGPLGVVVFDAAPADGDEIRVIYSYAGYTDDEITALVADTGNVSKAVIEAIRELLANSAKLYNYSQGATQAELSQVFDHLSKLLDYYTKASNDEGNQGAGSVGIGKRTNEVYRRAAPMQFDLSRYDQEVYGQEV